MYYGAVTRRSDTTVSEVRNRLLGYPRVSIDEEIAKTAGELLARADDGAGGNGGIGWNDAQVAATADALDDAVLAENVTGFEALGVDVETY